MALYQVPILKAKATVEVDSSKLFSDDATGVDMYAYCLQLGMKAVLNRMSKIKKEDYKTEDEFKAAALAKAKELVEGLYTGKGIRMTGVKAKAKTAGAEKTEARRIAREVVREQIKAAGEKLKDYSAKDITDAADALIEANPEILAEAKANLAARAEKASKLKVDVKAITKSGKAAKAGAPLSATQAGIPAKKAPAPQPTAH